VSFDTWYRRLGHAGAEMIWEMISKRLVDSLEMTGKLTMRGRCKDCIFEKHITHPFNNEGPRETEILEHVHIDIWGPAQIQSAGGAFYFLMIIDGFLSY